MNLTSPKILLSGILAIIIIGGYSVSAVSPDPVLQITNTVAGYGTSLTLEGLDSFQPITIAVKSPTAHEFQFNTSSDSRGKVLYDIDDVYTRAAGTYAVTVVSKQGKVMANGAFIVYSDGTSKDSSAVTVSKNIVLIGQYDFAKIFVKLSDTYGNPLRDHAISVISTRPTDVVKPYQDGISKTDANGMVAFAVTSTIPGESAYAAYDMTTQNPIGDPVKIVYADTGVRANSLGMTGGRSTLSASILSATGGDVDASAQATLEAGPADSFKIEELPSAIQTNQPVDFTVKAYDINKKIAVGYRGTIHFSALGENGVFVSLPKDYTFTAQDLGQHIFPLSLQFQQEGTYQIQVADIEKKTVLGLTSIVVKGGSAAASSTSSKVVITAPSPGSYSSNVQIVTGTAPAGKDVKVYDNNEEIGTAVANVQGGFTFTSQPLADGPHEFSAVSVDQKGVILSSSEKIKITVDTQPPTITSVILTPSFEVTPGLPIQIELQSEEKLKKAILDVSGVVSELSEDLEKAGLYHGSFAAPDKDGDYDLKFTLEDALGNQAVLTHDTKLAVHTAGQIKAVQNIRTSVESFRVTLQWDVPSGGASNIDHYRIYYGTDPNNLAQKVDTAGNVNSWYIPNLSNGTQYFFGVVAVDKEGYLGEAGTLAIATPSDGSIGADGLPVADSYISSRYLRGETGPEIMWLVPLSYGTFRLLRRKLRSGTKR